MKYFTTKHPTIISFSFDFFTAKRVAKTLKPNILFTLSFVSLGVIVRWFIANFIAGLKVILDFDRYHYVPLRHIEAVGVQIEYYNDFIEFSMVNWDNGRCYKRNFGHQNLGILKTNLIEGELKIDIWEGEYTAKVEGKSCQYDFEHLYQWGYVTKHPAINCELKIT
jgi:hypothetical protein